MRKHVLALVSFIGIAMILGLFSPLRACAQDQEGDDPPSRVARLSYTQGAVSFQPAGTDDWVDAIVNRPMTTGDKLWSDNGSRAALHIGSASIHLSQNTGFSFLNLTDNVAQLQLTAGTLRIRVKRLGDDDNFEVDTPNLAFTILAPGIYKISVNEAGDTTIVEDRRGQGQVTGGGSEYDVYEGDRDTFSGTDQIAEDVGDLDSPDDFEQWSEQRDHHEDASVSARYVSDDAIGYDDLDDNGDWRPVPEYGTIWFPRTAEVGWAPYHYGHWAYIAPWGYSWVDDASWGFAPFHYGRWVSVNGAWGWVPCAPRPAVAVYGGPVYVRPVYAPALVAWVGGPGFSVGVGVGGGFAAGANVAWFPLGPREVYVPSYPVSRNYVTNVNVSNTRVETTVVNNYYNTVVVNKTVTVTNVTYVNQRVPGAVVATSGQAFTSGGAVSRNVVRVDARAVASAPVAAVTPPAVPQRTAVLGGRAASTRRPPATIQARAVVAKTAPPPPAPSFEQRQEAIKSNGGRPISIAASRKITPVRSASAAPAPQVKVAPAAKPTPPRNAPAAKMNRPPIQKNGNHAVNAQQNQNNANRPPANAQQPVQNNRPNNAQQPANNNRPANAQQNNANRPPSQPAANNNRPAAEPPANNNRPAENPANNNRPPSQPAAKPEAKPATRNDATDRPPAARPSNQPPEKQQKENQPAPKPKPDQTKQPPPQKQPQPKEKEKDKDKDKDKAKQEKPKDDRPPKNNQ